MNKSGASNRQAGRGWSRLKPISVDYLESIGLPSKGDNRYVTPNWYDSTYNIQTVLDCWILRHKKPTFRKFWNVTIKSNPPIASTIIALMMPLHRCPLIDSHRRIRRPANSWQTGRTLPMVEIDHRVQFQMKCQ